MFPNKSNDVFSLQGLERLRPNTRVIWSSRNPPPPFTGEMIWNGEEIVGGHPDSFPVHSITTNRKRLFFWLSVNVLLISLFVLYRTCFRKRKSYF